MRTPQPLQKDYVFEKLRFKHSEKLSKNVFDMMEGGEKVYPHEGLKEADFIINRIRVGTVFSEEAFQYALYRSHEYALADGERCRETENLSATQNQRLFHSLDRSKIHSSVLAGDEIAIDGARIIVHAPTSDFPEKKRIQNNGEHQKYIQEDHHPSIISREMFRAVQEMRESRSNIERHVDGTVTRKAKRYTGKKG